MDKKIKHIDCLGDTLEHYGVIGMKWGKARINRLKERSLQYKDQRDQYNRAAKGNVRDLNNIRTKTFAKRANTIGQLGGHITNIVDVPYLNKQKRKYDNKAKKAEAKIKKIKDKISKSEKYHKSLNDLRTEYKTVRNRKVGVFDFKNRKKKSRDLSNIRDRIKSAKAAYKS